MQQIQTRDWTQITGLTSEKTYLMQAQIRKYDGKQAPVDVMWLQASAAPASTDIGMIDNKLKASAAAAIYVKSPIDCMIITQEIM